jgi:uncharacterized protein
VECNVRLTIQGDAPPDEDQFQNLTKKMDSNELVLFSTDYSHWQFDGERYSHPACRAKS